MDDFEGTHGGLRELALFAGAGGGILGGILLGWRTVCAVENDPYAASVLMQRQNDGVLPPFPIWDDVRTFDGKPWRGRVDVVSGGFPCQDISAAGRGAGIDGARSGLWKDMARIIGEVRPRFCFVENSPVLASRGLGRVLGDLAEMGYDARWGVLGAVHAGAPHKRERIWIVANADEKRECGLPQRENAENASAGIGGEDVADSESIGAGNEREDVGQAGGEIDASDDAGRAHGRVDRQGHGEAVRHSASAGLPNGTTKEIRESRQDEMSERSDWWEAEPDVGRVAHEVAARVDRLKAIGNGQVPVVAALAWRILNEEL